MKNINQLLKIAIACGGLKHSYGSVIESPGCELLKSVVNSIDFNLKKQQEISLPLPEKNMPAAMTTTHKNALNHAR